MKKITLSSILVAAMTLPVAALAQTTPPTGVPSISSLSAMITYIEQAMWVIFGGIAVIAFVTAGILFLVAGGQPEKIQAARSAFIWGVAGVVVGIVAYSIIAIVSSVMGGTGQ